MSIAFAPAPRLRIDGLIDAATVEEFDSEVRTAGSTGGRSLAVDLAGVTHLASAGVAALHRLTALHRDNGTTPRRYAPPAQRPMSS
ncbi:STAS domain-containing protein [Amycolatopsis sp. NPDC048633]|uniref:STAS domain-containing protein n=1 Tax=Amycolatopsis sp. NPDC048633 TaxID=3157095 RepID=UPI0033D441B2